MIQYSGPGSDECHFLDFKMSLLLIESIMFGCTVEFCLFVQPPPLFFAATGDGRRRDKSLNRTFSKGRTYRRL